MLTPFLLLCDHPFAFQTLENSCFSWCFLHRQRVTTRLETELGSLQKSAGASLERLLDRFRGWPHAARHSSPTGP